MLEAFLIFLGGLLGSAHCVGMCGGFVLTLGGMQRSWAANLGRQLLYAGGRILTYALGGAIIGFGGWKLGREASTLVNAQALLAIVAGALLVVEGLFSAGLVRRPWLSGHQGCPGAGAFASIMRAPHAASVFAAGVFNGLLPCGLVYAYLALAASTGSVGYGAAVMALFGLGTVPLLTVTGLSGSLLGLAQRRRLFLIAAWCMIVTGGISLARGVGFLNFDTSGVLVCPWCDARAAAQ